MTLDSPIKLSISCVYFDTDEKVFDETIESLAKSIQNAKRKDLDINSALHLINNNAEKDQWFIEKVKLFEYMFDNLTTHIGHGNIGYGRANNLAILSTISDYHLVLNPDVFLAEDNIYNAIKHMQNNLQLDAVAADAFDSANNRLYLAKRNPSLIVLLIRALNIRWLNECFKKQLDIYEYRDLISSSSKDPEIELMSGCYMFIRTKKLKSINGFNEKYFLYFEDFDLSRRLQKKVLASDVRIIHHGGKAARKGTAHFFMFSWSMLKFLYFRRIHNN